MSTGRWHRPMWSVATRTCNSTTGTAPRHCSGHSLFLPKVPYYMLLDRISRPLFSQRFFANYQSVAPWQLERWIQDAGEAYWRRHLLPEALLCIEEHRQQRSPDSLSVGRCGAIAHSADSVSVPEPGWFAPGWSKAPRVLQAAFRPGQW